MKYWERATKMTTTFEKFTLLHVPRDQNERADLLSKLASTQKKEQQKSIILENLSKLTVEKQEVCCIGERRTWISPFLEYLGEDRLPSDATEAKKCVDEDEYEYIIWEVHEGVCGTHIGGRALASKIARASYYLLAKVGRPRLLRATKQAGPRHSKK
ncbi:hypothetical protein CR513_15600, partial [Mucuna pruriens]